jgi:aerobic-type carbon monoxide dehydrogenase small subunit (CoxS/CutS family)
MPVTLKVNGASRTVPAEPDTPLLYVLRNDFALNGAKFGCGLAQCGAWTHNRIVSAVMRAGREMGRT